MENLSIEDWNRLRSGYTYVPAKLISGRGEDPVSTLVYGDICLTPEIPEQTDWSLPSYRRRFSSIELDDYHQRLLVSAKDSEVLQGLLSVVFWGFSSSAGGKLNKMRALARARQLIVGRRAKDGGQLLGTPLCDTIAAIENAREALARGAPGEALRFLMTVRFLGMSFASKVLMFVAPTRATVYDSVVYRKLANDPDFPRNLIVNPTTGSVVRKAAAYEAWCSFCANKAGHLEKLGCQWTDWDGTSHSWRAVDVERAIFAMP